MDSIVSQDVPPPTTTAADEDYAQDNQPTDYYPSPEPVVHIGAHATHVTVHVHAYAPPPPPPLSSYPAASGPSASVEVDVRHERMYDSEPRLTPSSPPSRPSTTSPDRSRTQTEQRSVADTLGDTLAALPDGLLPPSVQAVVQQVLRRTTVPSPSDATAPAANEAASPAPRTTRLGQRGQNVAISLMMQPMDMNDNGTTTTSLTQLFRQLSGSGDIPDAQGVSLTDLNRHTEVVVHEVGRGLHDTCAVCQEMLETGHVVRHVLRCGHIFHNACLDQWLEANLTCPMCMQPVVPSNEQRDSDTSNRGPVSSPPPPPPPPPPPTLRPRSPPSSNGGDRNDDHVRQQADALSTSFHNSDEDNSPHTTAAVFSSDGSEEDEATPSHTQMRSAERVVRRIPIRVTGLRSVSASYPLSRTVDVESILDSALAELTLDTIEEDDEEST